MAWSEWKNIGLNYDISGGTNSKTLTAQKDYDEAILFVSSVGTALITISTNDASATLTQLSRWDFYNGQGISGIIYKLENFHSGKTITIGNYYSGGMAILE